MIWANLASGGVHMEAEALGAGHLSD